MKEVCWDWAVATPKNGTSCAIGTDNGTFRKQVLAWLEDTEKYPKVLGVIFFQNVDMSSSRLGESSMLMYGPGCTIEAIEPVIADPMKYFLGDSPSVRKYPQWFITRASHLAELAQGRGKNGRNDPDYVPPQPPAVTKKPRPKSKKPRPKSKKPRR